jgi:type III restriction enzyme
MLIQAAPRSKDRPTLHAEEVKKLLMEDFRVPEEHIAIATSDTRELDKVNLFDRDCRIRFIITQAALREGWDCSFAYVLCSVAEQKSSRAVEQILGRVLRLPHAKRKRREELNRAYAFATTIIAYQVDGRAYPGKDLGDLAGQPLSGRVACHLKPQQLSSAVAENQKCK